MCKKYKVFVREHAMQSHDLLSRSWVEWRDDVMRTE